jgi:hypothetical protein
MRNTRRFGPVFALVCLLGFALPVSAQSELIEQLLAPSSKSFAGLFSTKGAQLRMRHTAPLHLVGQFRMLGLENPLEATVLGNGLAGSVMMGGRREDLRASWQGDVLQVRLGQRSFAMKRTPVLTGLAPENVRKAFWKLRTRRPDYDPKREWTVVVYMAADNDLEKYAIADLLEMEAAIPEEGVEVIVLVDRAKGEAVTRPDWTDSRVYRIRRDGNPKTIVSPVLLEPGELDMGDPAVLSEFVGSALNAFPARHNMLVMWDHGGGWASQCVDHDVPGSKEKSSLSIVEVREGITRALRRSNIGRLDVVAFDQCLMSQIETAAELSGLADVMVASEALVPAYGMPYSAILPLLARPHLGSRRMAARMVEEFHRFFTKIGKPGQSSHFRLWVANTTFSALDVRHVHEAVDALNLLLDALEPQLERHWATLIRCLYYSEGYSERDEIFAADHAVSSVDLCDALMRMRRAIDPFPAEVEFRAFLRALDRFVVVSQTGDRRRSSNGVSIYAPATQRQWSADYLKTAFAKRSRWPGFLQKLHAKAAKERKKPVFANYEVRAGVGAVGQQIRPLNGSMLHFDLTGSEIFMVRRYVARREGNDLRMLRGELLVDPAFVLRRRDAVAREIDWVMPQFANGTNALRTELIGAQLTVSNGSETRLVTTHRSKLSSSAPILVQGVQYASKDAKTGTPVLLEFDPFFWTPTIKSVGATTSYRTPTSESWFAFKSEIHTPKGIVHRPGPRLQYKSGFKLALHIDPPGTYLLVLKAGTMNLDWAQSAYRYELAANPEIAQLTADWSKYKGGDLHGRFRQLVYTENKTVEPTGVICEIRGNPLKPNIFEVTTNQTIEGRLKLAKQVWILERSGTPSLRILEFDADDRVTSIYYGPAMLRKNDKQFVIHTKVLNYGGILWLWEKLPPQKK